jgi:hypothetical protein
MLSPIYPQLYGSGSLVNASGRASSPISDSRIFHVERSEANVSHGVVVVACQAKMLSQEVVNGEVVNGEVVNGEVVNGEVVNGEVVNGEVVNGEVLNREDYSEHRKFGQDAGCQYVSPTQTPELHTCQSLLLASRSGRQAPPHRLSTTSAPFRIV